jgi:predicted hydrocarbon binding protein
MKFIISLVARKRSGMLAQIATQVFRADCQLLDQSIAMLRDPEFWDVTLTLEGSEAAAEQMKAGLEALDGVLKVGYPSGPAAPAAAAAAGTGRPLGAVDVETRLQAALAEIVDAFPQIVDPVQRFAASFEGAGRREASFRLGQRMGRREYKRSFSLGSPLKLELALRRMVVPALRPFARAEVQDTTLRVPNCPFCINLRAAEPCCDFLGGFLQGFLDAHPGTPGLRVREVQCKACGHAECSFSCLPARG